MRRRTFIKNTGLSTAALGTFTAPMIVDYNNDIENFGYSFSDKSENEVVRVAVIQQDGNPGQVNVNREKALASAEEAIKQQADVILFHEELLVGYVENLQELAEPVDGQTSKAFQKLLKGTDTLIIYGLTERDGEDLYISAPIVSEKGVQANYRKTHLWWKAEGLRHEPTFYKPGNKLVTFEVKGHKSGIMICYDGDFPEMTRSYANRGCRMVFWMNNRGSRGHEEVKDLAYRNSMIMLTACCSGLNEVGGTCRGGSNITGPKGELIEEIWMEEGIIMADVIPGEVPDIRAENPWFKGQRGDIYYY